MFKEAIADTVNGFITKEGFKGLYGVSFYRNAIYIMINSAVLALSGLFFWMAAARLYPKEAVGFASAAIAVSGLLTFFSTLGLDYGLIRFLPRYYERARDIINSCFTIGGLLSIALAFVFLAGVGIWSPALLPLKEHLVYFAAFVLFVFATTLQNFTNQTFLAERKADFVLAQSLFYGLLRFVPLFVLASLFPAFGIFVSLGIAAFVSVAVGIILLLPRVQKGYYPFPLVRKRIINEMVSFSFANYIANFLWILPALTFPLMVVNRLGAEQNAYFYIGWSAASTLFMIPQATSLSLFAESSHDVKQLGHNIKKSLKLISVLLILPVIIFVLLGDKILLLFGRDYAESAIKLFGIIAISVLPASVNHIYCGIKKVEMKMKSVIGLSAFIAIFTIGISYFLLPQMGILGVGVAWLLGQGVAAVVVVRALWGRHR